MTSGTIIRYSQVTIPNEIQRAVGIFEGDRVKLSVVEGNKIVIEKAKKAVWKNCTDFLPDDFEKMLADMRSDSTNRFKQLGVIP
jgi:AbrB family looped-hinge helix DNA binding protein